MRPTRAFAAAVGAAVLLVSARAADAQAAPTPVAATAATTAEVPDMRWRAGQCMGGLTYGAPFKVALSYGGGYVYEGDRWDLCAMAVAKVGLGAAGASVGLAKSFGSLGSGAAITGGLIRTFGDPLNATARRSYAGGSVHLWALLGIGGEIGYYAPLGDAAGDSARARRMFVWSAGIGF
jgi:hypothetical protein